jgi:hypothetical protein
MLWVHLAEEVVEDLHYYALTVTALRSYLSIPH